MFLIEIAGVKVSHIYFILLCSTRPLHYILCTIQVHYLYTV